MPEIWEVSLFQHQIMSASRIRSMASSGRSTVSVRATHLARLRILR